MKERNWQAKNLNDVDKQISDPQFIQRSACGCLMPIHTFVKPGDSLEGRLRPCPNHDRADRAGAAHLYIPTKDGDELGVAFRLSNMLRQVIFDNNLWGNFIRITYKGSVPTTFGHAKKIYLVEVDKGTAKEKFETVPNKPIKSQKPRKRRPVRRPMSPQRKSQRLAREKESDEKERTAICDTAAKVKQAKAKLFKAEKKRSKK